MTDAEKEKEKGANEQARLEAQLYYHGIRETEEVISELRHSGDFIVRATLADGVFRIFLHVKTKKELVQHWLCVVNNKYCLDTERNNDKRMAFDSVALLINHYAQYPLPSGQRLVFGVPRPKWLIRHSSTDYKDQDRLGSGNFCEVFKGTMTMDGVKKIVAIKVCHGTTDPMDAKLQEVREAWHSMLYEAKIMSKYRHENIIEFLGVACDHPPIRIILEYCPGGSLESHLKNDKIEISQVELVLYAFETAKGMRYLHTQKCLHRDLAARNCLISSKGQLKISDFGLSQLVDDMEGKKDEKKISNVPLKWMAPETLSKSPVYLLNSDVWSYGVLLYEIFNKGKVVFDDEDDFKKVAKKIHFGEMPKFPHTAPELIRTLVREEIWQVEPEKRTMFTEIVPLLLAYLEEHMAEFPQIDDLAVNKIKGVKRLCIFYTSRQDLLKRDHYIGGVSRRRSKGRPRSKEEARPRHSKKKKSLSKESKDLKKNDERSDMVGSEYKDYSDDSKKKRPEKT
ncbi:unnamed protein product [Bursaphelenchus xylophilus]|uniref:Tyrosine-protein kinase n=1 Tax=Bursaphelenchus xylophilus TaxID=6326 RepID=A0A1I7RX65_BURXY|nr:unnamed protein product [Bursaphelenchus xylophilus]CAG9121361.1 unnamed protein product [Bursaphelenchus xylophilus]